MRTAIPHSLIFLRIVGIFCAPVLLIYFDVVSYDFRLWILCFLTLLVSYIIFKESWSSRSLGLRIDTLKIALLPYIFFTV